MPSKGKPGADGRDKGEYGRDFETHAGDEIRRLEQELSVTRRDLQSHIEQLRSVNERKLREEARITRLTTLYAMLSGANEAIVRAHDQGSLYGEVCRIIAEVGAFPLIWIGEVKGRQVAPVAACGPAVDYLREIRVEVDGALGQGPTGEAVREDRPVVNDDFDTNAAASPWREPALRHGIRASAAFPLRRQGRVVGALTLYAVRPGDFDAEQVNLLEALSANISYALDTMEQERLRTRAEADLQHSLRRFELLAHTAGELLRNPDPQKLANSLCREVMEYLDCQAFFNFLVVEEVERLRLNAYAGIPEEEARRIEWLDYGVAVCGCAARAACRIVAEHIPTTPDPRTDLVKSYGIKAYACHPLLGPDGKVIGTLSFGTCRRETFGDEDLSLMKAVADQVAVAMIRMKDDKALKRARDELEERVKERTRVLTRQANLLNLTQDAVFVRDREDRVTFWNRGAEELYGWTAEETVGKVPHELLLPRVPEGLGTVIRALSTQGSWEGELQHTTKDGRAVTVSSRVVRWDEDGRPSGTLEVNRDITERKQAEKRLRQAQKMEALGTLTGGIAHDFNNILAAIIGFSEMIKDRVPEGSRERRHAARVLEAGIRGRELVKQMLTFSRQTEQEKTALRLSSIVKESVKLLRASIPSTIGIKVNVESESGLVLGDPVQIQQVLMNLATNAAHAMLEKGGVLDIKLSDFSVSPSNGNSHGIEPGLYMKLLVSDTGAGIPAGIIDRIFDPFFTTKGVGEGTGLGLSVVMGIVRQFHGHITVESQPGKGSTFCVYFPKIVGAPADDKAARDETVPTGHECILFVDDEEALVEMGEELLAELGYQVVSKTSSREALATVRLDPTRFDLVITDQTMPELAGVELAKEILAVRPDMPIILCTGFSHIVNEDSAKAAGIRAFAMKPLTRREISRTIRNVLGEEDV
ncbi:MAG: GAF domain-containing protein [Syntrophorhabdales bacterium]|jgi:PAS domain S-box-containing protein